MHRALKENPAYIEGLKNLAEASEAIVAPPVTQEEVATWQDSFVCFDTQESIMHARGSTFWLPEKRVAELVGEPEQQVLEGKLFDTFSSNEITHKVTMQDFAEMFKSQGMLECIAATDKVLVYRDMEYLRFLPDWAGAMSYYGALQTISNRFRSEEAQLQAALALGDDPEYGLLVRVQKRTRGVLPKRAALDAIIEGYDSIAFAGAHLELGGANGLSGSEQFANAILSYTKIIPESGLLGPMALRGSYFVDFASRNGEIKADYKTVFTQRKAENDTKDPRERYVEEPDVSWLPTGPPYDPESCNRIGFPPPIETKTDPEYQGERCPGIYGRIILTAAKLFSDKVSAFAKLDSPTPRQLNLAPIIEAAKTATSMLR